jgi:hypothetical protein
MAWAAGDGRTLEEFDLGSDLPRGPLGRFARFVKERF